MKSKAMVQRLSFGVVDQVLSSGTNFLALLLGARYLGAAGFGAFSVAMVTYTITLGINRALICEALLVRPGVTAAAQHDRSRQATAAAMWIGLFTTLLIAAAAVVISGPLERPLLFVAVVMPGLLIQDTLRYAAFSRGDPKAAVSSDLCWLVGQVLTIGILVSAGSPTAGPMVLAWAIPGVVAGIVRLVRESVVPALSRWIAWIMVNRDLSVRYALDFVSGAGAAQLASYVLAAVAGVAAVGGLRGAQTVFGPVNILLTGSYIVLVPEGRRAAERSGRMLTWVCAGASASFAAVAIVMMALYLHLTDAQGAMLLGRTWPTARELVVPVGLASIAGCVLAGAMTGLRSLSAASALLRTRMITIPTTLALPIAGAIGWGAQGLAYGIAISVWWNVGWYWRSFFRALRALDSGVGDDGVIESLDLSTAASGTLPSPIPPEIR